MENIQKVNVYTFFYNSGESYGFSDGESSNTAKEARDIGEEKRGKGKVVIVRPEYNETDSQGRFFREWRSFDGAEFNECKWRF